MRFIFSRKLSCNVEIGSKELYELDINRTVEGFRIEQYLTDDTEAISERQKALSDIRRNNNLYDAVEELLMLLDSFSPVNRDAAPASAIREIVFLKELHDSLKSFCSVTASMSDTLLFNGYAAAAETVEKIIKLHFGSNFGEEWKKYAQGINFPRSITLGFRLSEDFKINSCGIISVNSDIYGKSVYPTCEPDDLSKPCSVTNLTQLQRDNASYAGYNEDEDLKDCLRRAVNALTESKFADLKLKTHASAESVRNVLLPFRDELRFLTGAVKLTNNIESYGFPMCFPKIAPQESNIMRAEQAYHPEIAKYKSSELVQNDVDFCENGELFILTGARHSGKTTYLRTVGAMQLFFQAGLPVCAKKAVLSPVKRIVMSSDSIARSAREKLDSEIAVLKTAVKASEVPSLVLLDEPVTAASPVECILISREIIAVLKVNGCRGIWATRLYDLTADIESMKESLPGSSVSLLFTKVNERTGESEHRIERS